MIDSLSRSVCYGGGRGHDVCMISQWYVCPDNLSSLLFRIGNIKKNRVYMIDSEENIYIILAVYNYIFFPANQTTVANPSFKSFSWKDFAKFFPHLVNYAFFLNMRFLPKSGLNLASSFKEHSKL